MVNRSDKKIIDHSSTEETGVVATDANCWLVRIPCEVIQSMEDSISKITLGDESSGQVSTSGCVPARLSSLATIDAFERRSAYCYALTSLRALAHVTAFTREIAFFALDDTPFARILKNIVAVNEGRPAKKFESLLGNWAKDRTSHPRFDGATYEDVVDFLQAFQTALFAENFDLHNAVSTTFRRSGRCPKCQKITERSEKSLHIDVLPGHRSVNQAISTISPGTLTCCGDEITMNDCRDSAEWGPVIIATLNVGSSGHKFVDMHLRKYDIVAVVSCSIIGDEASTRHYTVSIKSPNGWTFYNDDRSYKVLSYADDQVIMNPAVIQRRTFFYQRRANVSPNHGPRYASACEHGNRIGIDDAPLNHKKKSTRRKASGERSYVKIDENQFRCKFCNKFYKYPFNVTKHCRQAHPITNDQNSDIGETNHDSDTSFCESDV